MSRNLEFVMAQKWEPMSDWLNFSHYPVAHFASNLSLRLGCKDELQSSSATR